MELKELSPKRHNAYKNDKIQKISSKFVDIYNEAEHAESEGLMEICGMGYRKALEFLIKDYLISLYPNETESIKTELLSKSINRISYDKLKKVATKSAWLGNDQAHYVQKYENRDIDDLKKYIDATVHWILTEYLTNEDL